MIPMQTSGLRPITCQEAHAIDVEAAVREGREPPPAKETVERVQAGTWRIPAKKVAAPRRFRLRRDP